MMLGAFPPLLEERAGVRMVVSLTLKPSSPTHELRDQSQVGRFALRAGPSPSAASGDGMEP